MNSEKRYEEGRKLTIIFLQKTENPFYFVLQNTTGKFYEEYVPNSPGLP
jgi:hypothetical protein